MKIKLEDLARALEKSDILQGYVDTKEGRVVSLEETDEEEVLSRALRLEDDFERYVPLSNIFDGDEIEIMRAFARVQTPDFAARLQKSLEGQGACLHFRQQVKRLLLQKKWEKFLHDWFREQAKYFCEENEIAYEE